uniref:response regulator n=1 Tax=uncultured Caulobacter sp. TaxID=158749 RepID=UPI0025DF12F5|nr:response regulator [uncultured Caulobacter sp.]
MIHELVVRCSTNEGRGIVGQALGRHALIIEDEALISIEIEALLGDQGFETFDWAVSPHEALDCARGRRPDLITADMRIIDGTGLEAVRAILDVLGQIPVIYVTANSDMLAGQGELAVVAKPIMPSDLAAACRRVCLRA